MEKLQSDLDRDRQYCELCGKMENLLKCGRCRSSFYCSKEHQKQDWKKHKLICKEMDKAQLSKQKPEQPPQSEDDKAPEKYREKISPEQADSASFPQPTNTEAPGDGDGLGEEGSNNTATPNGQTSASPQKLAMEYIVPCMNKHGICVVDNFLGAETGLGILDNVIALHKTGKFTDGQLVSQKSDSTKDIRGDKITWIEGKEAGSDKIRFLMSRMDDLIRHCNGKLGNYTINGRTKAMVACYPGKGTGYVRHVDNPNGDGRCVTCIYYLNKDWTAKFFKNLFRNRNCFKSTGLASKSTLLSEDRQVCITTDNGANVVKAVSLKDWTRLQCFGHRLHLAIEGSVREKRIQRAMGVCKKVVSAFSFLWKKKRQLAAAQEELKLPKHKLITESPTRWGSRHATMARVLEQEKAIAKVLSAD